MKFHRIVLSFVNLAIGLSFALGSHKLSANTLGPGDLTNPFGVQPVAGLTVTGGVTQSFFSDLSGLPFTGPDIVDILGDVQAFDSSGNPISSFHVTGVTVKQGSTTVKPKVDTFSLTSPITYTDFANPFNAVTIDPSHLNLAFIFNSDPSFQYSYALDVTGIPDGGFVLYNDVEGARTPEPGTWSLMAFGIAALFGLSYRRHRVWRPEE